MLISRSQRRQRSSSISARMVRTLFSFSFWNLTQHLFLFQSGNKSVKCSFHSQRCHDQGTIIFFLVLDSTLQIMAFCTQGTFTGEQGWRSGESSRLPPMWRGFESWCRRHMWVEFVVGSLPCSERFFSGYSGFPLSLKTNTSKFQFDLERADTF